MTHTQELSETKLGPESRNPRTRQVSGCRQAVSSQSTGLPALPERYHLLPDPGLLSTYLPLMWAAATTQIEPHKNLANPK